MSTDDAAGGCLCGAVRYAVEGRPLSSLICHCRSCRRASGAPSVAWITVDAARFRWLGGVTQRFGSTPGVFRVFCPRCGTPLVYESDAMPGMLDVTTASLDDPSRFPPTRETWVSHRIAWEPLDGRIAQLPRGTEGTSDDGVPD
jgi:hypothetical protein